MNIQLTIAYDGSQYYGWQRLKDNDKSIQGKIEETLSKLLDEKVKINGSGRTDKGVHAENQIANFKTMRDVELDELHRKLNKYLPTDIRITGIDVVSERFHARLNAKYKVYEYTIDLREVYNPFSRKFTHHVNYALHADKMRSAGEALIGKFDFSSFTNRKSKNKSNTREIYSIQVIEKDEEMTIRIIGDGFLQNMVRIIVGTLIEVGKEKLSTKDVKDILEKKSRDLAGEMAPAKGLVLKEVGYEKYTLS